MGDSLVSAVSGKLAQSMKAVSGDLSVDITRVLEIATELQNLNQQINDGLTKLCEEVNDLGRTWQGNASQQTISQFMAKTKQYNEDRNNVVENVANFLKVCVGEGYEQTEKVNTSLADEFR